MTVLELLTASAMALIVAANSIVARSGHYDILTANQPLSRKSPRRPLQHYLRGFFSKRCTRLPVDWLGVRYVTTTCLLPHSSHFKRSRIFVTGKSPPKSARSLARLKRDACRQLR